MAIGHTLINIFVYGRWYGLYLFIQQQFIQLVLTISLFSFWEAKFNKPLYGQSPVISILPIVNFHE